MGLGLSSIEKYILQRQGKREKNVLGGKPHEKALEFRISTLSWRQGGNYWSGLSGGRILRDNGYLTYLFSIFPTSSYLLYLPPPSLRFLVTWSLAVLLAKVTSLHPGCIIISCSINTKFSEKEHTSQPASLYLYCSLFLCPFIAWHSNE